jgi:hypothetical protein
MLLAPVSSGSGREIKSSSARKCVGVGATHPELVLPPRREDGALPAPEGAGLWRGGGDDLPASSAVSGLMPGALLVRTRGGLEREKDKS